MINIWVVSSLWLWWGTRLNRSGDSRRPDLVPNMVGKTSSLSSLSVMLHLSFSVKVFFLLSKFPSIPNVSSLFFFFNHEIVLDFVQRLSLPDLTSCHVFTSEYHENYLRLRTGESYLPKGYNSSIHYGWKWRKT